MIPYQKNQMTSQARAYGVCMEILFQRDCTIVDEDFDNDAYKEYCKDKKEQIGYISALQEDLFYKAMSVYDVCPDVVDTEMTKGLWPKLPKLTAAEVADADLPHQAEDAEAPHLSSRGSDTLHVAPGL